jgi:hypothetical protein
VQANKSAMDIHLPRVHIYTGEASAAWQADPTLHMDQTAYMTHRPAISMGSQLEIGHMSNSGYLDQTLASLSVKDAQARVNDILLLEVLAEQFTPPNQAPDVTATQVGQMAVQAQVG